LLVFRQQEIQAKEEEEAAEQAEETYMGSVFQSLGM